MMNHPKSLMEYMLEKVRVGAVLANAKILASVSSTLSEKQVALDVIKGLAEALVVLGVYEHIQWKNPIIQQIVEKSAIELGYTKNTR